MPVHFGCVEFDARQDVFIDQEFIICKDTGIIQVKEFPTTDLLYMTSHNDAIGKVWQQLFDSVANAVKIAAQNKKNLKILEIGGGSGKLAEKLLSILDVRQYDLFEPNLLEDICVSHEALNIVRKYYTEESAPKEPYDLVIHSHVLEHVEDPIRFMKTVSSNIDDKTVQIFVVPNLKETFSKKYTNALNFEHTFFLTEEYVDVILNNEMMKIQNKEYFLDHSIIYTVKKEENIACKKMPNLFEEHIDLLESFINYHESFVQKTNQKIKNFDGDVFLFGGHIFSQYLIGFGLETDKIASILDNSPIKIGKRLYGTNLWVHHPNVIEGKKCAVILKVASYREEIIEQLLKINPSVVIIE